MNLWTLAAACVRSVGCVFAQMYTLVDDLECRWTIAMSCLCYINPIFAVVNTWLSQNVPQVSCEFYHASVVMLFRSKISILCYFLFLYKFSVLYHSKCIAK